MIISLIYGRDNYDQDVYPYSYLIRLMHELFNEKFNSIYCRDILLPLKEKYQEHPCLSTYEKGIEIILNVLFDSEELLNNISIEDMNK